MISAFGPRAHRYAGSLGDIDAIVTDPGYLPAAYFDAVARRERGDHFYGLVLFDDYRAALAQHLVLQVFEQTGDFDARLEHVAALAEGSLLIDGKPAAEAYAKLPRDVVILAPEFFALADAMLVRSYAEVTRWEALLKRMRSVELFLIEPTLPDVTPRPTEPSVVLWAPHEPAERLALPVFALSDFPGPVAVICAGGALPAFQQTTIVPVDDARVPDLLAKAAVVVCPDLGDPGAAVAFARRGFRVAAPVTSGAPEFIFGVATYDPVSARSLLDAVGVALARSMTVRTSVPGAPRALLPPAAAVPRDALPLASVVIVTYNRPDDLERALTSASNQTYPNLEIVVVNDAGAPVESIVERFPHARLVNQPQNSGVNLACIAGYAEARGEYLQLLADDDILYPDHVERLVIAMLRNGAGAAHSNTLIRYQQRADDGRYHTTGFNALTFNDTTTASGALVTTAVSGQSIMIRRDVFDAIGGWTDRTFLSDQELQLRTWRRCPVIWVDHMTSEWRVRPKGSNFSSTVNSAEELGRVYDMHPVPDRPVLQMRRDATIRNVSKWPVGFVFPPTIEIKVTKLP